MKRAITHIRGIRDQNRGLGSENRGLKKMADFAPPPLRNFKFSDLWKLFGCYHWFTLGDFIGTVIIRFWTIRVFLDRNEEIRLISSIFDECRDISDSIFEILCFQYMFWITLYMFRLFFPESDRYEYFKTKLSRDKNRDWESCAKEVVSRWWFVGWVPFQIFLLLLIFEIVKNTSITLF